MCFSATVVLAEKKLSNVRGFIDFLRSGEGLSSFKGENSANLTGAKKYSEASGEASHTRGRSDLVLESKGL